MSGNFGSKASADALSLLGMCEEDCLVCELETISFSIWSDATGVVGKEI